MAITVALNHKTLYTYDRRVKLSPQVVRLRPAPHARTPIEAYSLKVSPQPHFINWQQDPQSNWQARLVFPEPVDHFHVEVDLLARMEVFNPFDFFLDASAETVPFKYPKELQAELRPFLTHRKAGRRLQAVLDDIEVKGQSTIDFLVEMNQLIQQRVAYTVRMEPGVQKPDETLKIGSGSCRDSGWLLVQLFRHLGFAARFVSGYLIQLKADQQALDGPSGTDTDFTDLHAWCEVYVPGAGWIGLDPTSGLFAGEGHIPLAATPEPGSAAPISGAVDECEVEFEHHMAVSRFHETPRVTKPYSDDQWAAIDAVGEQIDAALADQDVRLTMGGEPTFVSIDDMEGAEWNTAAVGPTKQKRAAELAQRLAKRYAPQGLLSYGQGKWYPGESLPRWAYSIIWRSDGQPVWTQPDLLALSADTPNADIDAARDFADALTRRLGVPEDCAQPTYEDALHYLAEEGKLPPGMDVTDADLDDAETRARLARVFSKPLSEPRSYVLPIQRWQTQAQAGWMSEVWKSRRGKLFLIPGDSAAGLRLPLDQLPSGRDARPVEPVIPADPMVQQRPLAAYGDAARAGERQQEQPRPQQALAPEQVGSIRTALVLEPRDGLLSVFMPPTHSADDYLALLEQIEAIATDMQLQVRIEGYPPPHDPRLQLIKITPDPGVIEVNIHPSASWRELCNNTDVLYEEARLARLGTEKFMVDGRHAGTGGGNHIVLGAQQAADSPFLRRPDLLASVIRYWQNHPSLSYLFSGLFIGPTSQSPRVDEARDDTLYELEVALSEVPDREQHSPPWLVDRIFRNLLTDLTGNTHRAEVCIDKLYSPDSSTGRLGLVEFRAFEMPPHAQMSLAQQLLVRGLVAWFWQTPYQQPLRRWGTRLHDEMLLPHYLERDLAAIVSDLQNAGFDASLDWFAPHIEFRFPHIGTATLGEHSLELRTALEPWPTMGEEPSGGGTARYVDSSLERLQVKLSGPDTERYVLLCNGRRVPLARTETSGVQVGGVRYRAWQPWSCLHPTIAANSPLTFDLYDTVNQRSVGGCTYHVHHPGGRNYDSFPVNANAAESRRLSRFQTFGHSAGALQVPPLERNPRYRVTLDLRRPAQARL